MNDRTPLGERFSQVYLQRGEPTGDSPRMRRRVSALTEHIKLGFGFIELVTAELGVDVPTFVNGEAQWPYYFAKCETRDLLDTITLVSRWLEYQQDSGVGGSSQAWVRNVNRIFSEENVRYKVDAKGGVHFSIDEEFARNHASTISALQDARYANVRSEFDQAHGALDSVPPNGKEAIRKTFTAAEGLFKLMFPGTPRLGAKEARAKLDPLIQRLMSGDKTALRSSAKIISAFTEWVEAAHFYRHEQGSESVAQPGLSFAVNLVSLGAAHIRWLAEIDARESKRIQ